MYISSLRLSQFRNYESLHLELDSGTNIFYGNNAQGKTNILEAVYTCGTSRSHKGARDKELVRFGQTEAHIRMEVFKDDTATRFDMHIRPGMSKGIAVNGLPLRRARDLLSMIHLIFFSPEDLNIIREGPSFRRRFMDEELCQLDPVYLSDLSEYNKVLMNRNQLLKDIPFHPQLLDTLDVWDQQLVLYGTRIIKKRQKFVEETDGIISDIHEGITGGKEKIRVEYEADTEAGDFERNLIEGRERDLKIRSTGTGPHRDDMRVSVKNTDIRRFGSQGQQRTAALSLKLSELQMIRQKTRQMPVLLLDDVLSELDSERQKCLLDSIHDIQTLITCTGLDEFIQHRFTVNKVFQVVNGKVF